MHDEALNAVHTSDEPNLAGDSATVKGFVTLTREQFMQPNLLPVHRLDKLTSGLCVLAKTKACAAEFGRLFESKQVQKYYLALSDKKPSKKQGAIIGDMEKGRNGSWKLCASKKNPALTQFFSYSYRPGVRLFILKPRTGKTHQLRVALKSLGAPILGDTRYYGVGPKGEGGASREDRMYLHAYHLSFDLGGENYLFQQLPADGLHFLSEEFKQLITSIGNLPGLPWPEMKQRFL